MIVLKKVKNKILTADHRKELLKEKVDFCSIKEQNVKYQSFFKNGQTIL